MLDLHIKKIILTIHLGENKNFKKREKRNQIQQMIT